MDVIDNVSASKKIAPRIRRRRDSGNLSEAIACGLRPEIEISSNGKKLVNFISSDAHFHQLVAQAKKLEANDPVELKLLLDQHVLERERTSNTFRIDAHCISIYERMGEYASALKIARELLSRRPKSVIIGAFFRICRKMGNYRPVDQLLAQYPKILSLYFAP
jgi:hypothetical protein